MPITSDEYNGVRVLSVEGDLVGETAAALRHHADELAGDAGRFVLDLAKSPAADSEGLESLLHWKRSAEAGNGRLALAGVGEHCRRVLDLTRLAHRFDFHPDLTSALKAMR